MPINPQQNCYCGNKQPYSECCQLYILGEAATTPEKLMRSRFTAFATANVDYIFQTQESAIHAGINKEDFKAQLQAQKWIHLEIVSAKDKTVAFIASMLYNDILYTMQENSFFEMKENRWIYSKALSHEAKERPVQRNEACPCGSQKKYKKCCQKD